MKRESRILKDLIKLTKDGSIKWDCDNYHLYDIYSTTISVTDKKSIDIDYYHHDDVKKDFIIFNYFNDGSGVTKELKEIFPYNKLSPFSYMTLNIILKRLYKNIKKKI